MFKISKWYCFCICLLLVCPFSLNGQTSNSSDNSTLFNEKIVLDKISEHLEKRRSLFILMDEKYFNLENLHKLFTKYKELYPEPYNLKIVVYSDLAMLQRLIKFESLPWVIEFSKDEKGRAAEKEFYEKYYPLPKRYFRANYNRYGSFELFDYSPLKESPVMIRVTLKTQLKRLLNMKPQDAFFEAVRFNDFQAISALIEKGVDLNINDEHFYTPMFWASSQGAAETVNLLIKAGADVNYQNKFGFTALMLARYDVEILNLLIKAGAKINPQDKNGNTAIFYAITDEDVNKLKYLLENGADTKVKNKAGLSPLEFAERNLEISTNKTEIIKILGKY